MTYRKALPLCVSFSMRHLCSFCDATTGIPSWACPSMDKYKPVATLLIVTVWFPSFSLTSHYGCKTKSFSVLCY